MGIEIERKFLVKDLSVLKGLSGVTMRQGYLADGSMSVRVRLAGTKGFLTLKGTAPGLSRPEFEYGIPERDALDLLNNHVTLGSLDKIRFLIPVGRHTFEVDMFLGPLAGLVVAEVELACEVEEFISPSWLGAEVSHDLRYTNAALAKSHRIPSRD